MTNLFSSDTKGNIRVGQVLIPHCVILCQILQRSRRLESYLNGLDWNMKPKTAGWPKRHESWFIFNDVKGITWLRFLRALLTWGASSPGMKINRFQVPLSRRQRWRGGQGFFTSIKFFLATKKGRVVQNDTSHFSIDLTKKSKSLSFH